MEFISCPMEESLSYTPFFVEVMFFILPQLGSFLDHTHLIPIKPDRFVLAGGLSGGTLSTWQIAAKLLVPVQEAAQHKKLILNKTTMPLSSLCSLYLGIVC